MDCYYILAKRSQNVRYPPAVNIFMYFNLNNSYKKGSLKLGVGLFNSPFKTVYLRLKSKLRFSISHMRLIIHKD